MALPADFSKIFGSTATGGLTPIGDVNYAKGWEFVGSNPPTKNDFSYLQNLSDLKSQWLYSNKLQRTDPFGDIKSDGTVSTALANLHLVGGLGTDVVGRLIGVKVITTSQTYTPSPGVESAIVDAVGAGGAGQGAGTQRLVGGGGGSGAYVRALITSLASSYAITIGSGGVGGTTSSSNVQAASGGATTFGSLISCGGGQGGRSDIPPSTTTGSNCIAAGGNGGTATVTPTAGMTVLISRSGSKGTYGLADIPNYYGGNGADSALGSGGSGGASAPVTDIFNATGFGSGGGGNTSVTTAAAGGNGGNGAVIIWEFA